MKRAREVSKKLYIEELERPTLAAKGMATTLAVGEEADGVTTLALGEEACWGGVTTMALGEEAGKTE